MNKMLRTAFIGLLMSAPTFAVASPLVMNSSPSSQPYAPSFQAQAPQPSPVKLPNMYKMAPIPPFMPVIFRYRSKLNITAAQWEKLKLSLKGNEAMMLSAMSTDRTLHEDILNGVNGAPLAAAKVAVQQSQANLLNHSVKADLAIRSILTPSQMAKLVSLYRQLENQNPMAQQQAPQAPEVNGVQY